MTDAIIEMMIRLQRANPVAFLELVEKCRDPKYLLQNYPLLMTLLQEHFLINAEVPEVHPAIKSIVLISVVGEGIGTRIVSPYQES